MSRDYLKRNEYTGDPLWLEVVGAIVFLLFTVGLMML